jgi:hypothetical protein
MFRIRDQTSTSVGARVFMDLSRSALKHKTTEQQENQNCDVINQKNVNKYGKVRKADS